MVQPFNTTIVYLTVLNGRTVLLLKYFIVSIKFITNKVSRIWLSKVQGAEIIGWIQFPSKQPPILCNYIHNSFSVINWNFSQHGKQIWWIGGIHTFLLSAPERIKWKSVAKSAAKAKKKRKKRNILRYHILYKPYVHQCPSISITSCNIVAKFIQKYFAIFIYFSNNIFEMLLFY